MPRKSNPEAAKVIPILLGVVCLLLLAVIALLLKGGGGFSKLEALPLDAFVEHPGDYLGNEYQLRAQIDGQLEWEKGTGRLMAVLPEGRTARVPVFVPAEHAENLHIGQRYTMHVFIEEGGLIYVEDLRKY
ncbi:hypothetical protein [Coraliomargarita parva]|uniref:hypothetical protein n=1 Tax=Coraliomargarita parva TaxID=3014050 RepID=UPI0022B3BED4|nr:hypothetical protein [Coraliomargarita parva]